MAIDYYQCGQCGGEGVITDMPYGMPSPDDRDYQCDHCFGEGRFDLEDPWIDDDDVPRSEPKRSPARMRMTRDCGGWTFEALRKRRNAKPRGNDTWTCRQWQFHYDNARPRVLAGPASRLPADLDPVTVCRLQTARAMRESDHAYADMMGAFDRVIGAIGTINHKLRGAA